MTEPAELCIAHELWHIDFVRSRAAGGARVVCLDFLVGRELARQGIPHLSLRDVVDSETGEEEWWLLAQEIAREWYRLPAMQFFQYQGIRIGEALEPIMLEAYLARLLYYVRVYSALKEKFPGARVTIPAYIVEDKPAYDCLVSFEWRAVVDAARMAGLRSIVVGTPLPVTARRGVSLSAVCKSLFRRASAALIGFLPRRPLKIYAGEYWSHIGTIVGRLRDAELVLMDSGELRHISWRQLLTHRIRARHPQDAVRSAERDEAARVSGAFMRQWEAGREDVAAYLRSMRRDLDWSPVLEACEYLMTYASRVIVQIGALKRIMEEERPDIVLQLASVSDRYHPFFIMARIAALLRIPSLELQHASAYVDPRAVYSRIETEYLATFGPDLSAWHERIGNARERLIPVGSPRFDHYGSEHADALLKGKAVFAQLGLSASRPVLFAAVPFSSENLFHFDSYQLAEFFQAIRAVQSAIPGLQVLFKCRNHKRVGATRAYLQELRFVDCAVAGSEEVFALLCASDAVVCGNSTLIYQAMLAKKPLVQFGWKTWDSYNVQMYAQALPFARTTREAIDIVMRIFADSSYREELLARQKQFLLGYYFDGRAAERMAGLIGRLARTNHERTGN